VLGVIAKVVEEPLLTNADAGFIAPPDPAEAVIVYVLIAKLAAMVRLAVTFSNV
jgi:hypothetical protein